MTTDDFDIYDLNIVDSILNNLRKNNISQVFINKANIKNIFICWLNIKARSFVEAGKDWIDSKLRDIDRDSDKTSGGVETNKIGKKKLIEELEKKYFGIEIEKFIENGYKKENKK